MVSRKGHDEKKRVGKAYPKNHMRTRTQTLQYATTQNARVFQFTAWAWLSVQPLTAVTSWTCCLTALGAKLLSCHSVTTNIRFPLQSLQTVSINVNPRGTHTTLSFSCCRRLH